MSLSQFFFFLFLLLQLYLSSFTHCIIPLLPFFSFFPPLMICFTPLKLSPKCLPSCQPYVAPRLCCDKLHQRSNCTVICLHCDGENTAHCVQCSQKVSYTLQTYVFLVCTVFQHWKKYGTACKSWFLENSGPQLCFFFSKQKISSLLECLGHNVACKTKKCL